MAHSPSPLNRQSLTRATMVGASLAVGGIVLFMILYAALGSGGLGSLARMVVALCIPPALMAVAMGGYFLLGRRKDKR